MIQNKKVKTFQEFFSLLSLLVPHLVAQINRSTLGEGMASVNTVKSSAALASSHRCIGGELEGEVVGRSSRPVPLVCNSV